MKYRNVFGQAILAATLLTHLSVLGFHSHAAAGDVDLTFDPGSSVTNPASVVVAQPDGKVLIGGPLTFSNGANHYASARLNADGSLDSAFVPRSFDPDIGYLGFPYDYRELTAFAVQPDGKVLVAAYYYEQFDCDEVGCRYNYRFSITRHHADGTRDLSFEPVVQNTYPPDLEFVSELGMQSDGKIVVGGRFASINGVTRSGLARLTASGGLDTSFVGQVPINYTASTVVVQPNDKLMIVSTAGGGIGQLARLNADGSYDSNFNPGPIIGNNTASYPNISSVAVQSDGKVLIGGSFTNVSGMTRHHIARLNNDGSLDSGFNPGTGANGAVRSIAVQPDGSILISGDFTTFNGTNCNRVARLNTEGSLDGSFHVIRGVESPVSTLVLQPNGQVLIGGPLTFIDGTNRYARDRLHADGRVDGAFVSSSFNPDLSFVIQTGDCRGGPDFECSQSWVVSTVLVQADGKVLVGGYSATVDVDLSDNHPFESYRSFLARVYADGSRDTSFAPVIGPLLDVPLGVNALAVQPDGKVLFGGFMVEFGRRNADGSPDNTFNPAVTGRHWIASIALQADGRMMIGGDLSTLHGTSVSYGVARLNADGALDSSFNPGMGSFGVLSVALQSDGKVLIGGEFTVFSGTPRNRMARLNSDGGMDLGFNPGTGADGVVRAIALQPDGNILIAGDFTTVNGVVRPYVARLIGDSPFPSLALEPSGSFLMLSWPVTALNIQLQETSDLALPDSWTSVEQPIVSNASHVSVAVPAAGGNRFFRLKAP